jgi:hypothetical protein
VRGYVTGNMQIFTYIMLNLHILQLSQTTTAVQLSIFFRSITSVTVIALVCLLDFLIFVRSLVVTVILHSIVARTIPITVPEQNNYITKI